MVEHMHIVILLFHLQLGFLLSFSYKDNLIPPELTTAQISYTYANETDILKVVLFGKTAKQWKEENSTARGNMRDVATLNQLLVLGNLESYNAVLINQGKIKKNEWNYFVS